VGFNPRGAAALAAQERREEKAADENRLFAAAIRSGEWLEEKKPRDRAPGAWPSSETSCAAFGRLRYFRGEMTMRF